MNRSVIIAAAIAAALALYFTVGTLWSGSDAGAAESAPSEQRGNAMPEAIISDLVAEPRAITLRLTGQTAPERMVTVKSATMGTVVSAPAIEGQFVEKGTLLCGLDIEARRANVDQAEAQRAAARIEYDAAKSLAQKGLSPANREASAKAALDAAEAAVSSAKIELGRTQIRAPFSGVFETRLAEIGDYLGPGSPCGMLVDLSPILVTVQLTEDQAAQVQPGQSATARLATGQSFPAKIRYVARTADARTRTFAVEAALETGDARVAAGITADLLIRGSEVEAIHLSPALLTLADGGEVGVRVLDESDIVRFMTVTVVDDAEDGIWVAGLPRKVRVVSAGQDFLAEGLRVKPIPAESDPS